MASVKVDDTDPRIQFSPDNLWTENDICIACDVSSKYKGALNKEAFNSTWRAAPGAQFAVKNIAINFNFSGSDIVATFILFRRTDNKGRTRTGGQSSISLGIDKDTPHNFDLTLDGWTNQELQQQFRFSQFSVPSAGQGNHTLTIAYVRDDPMEVPVTIALDHIEFTRDDDDSKSPTAIDVDPEPTPTPDSPDASPPPSNPSAGMSSPSSELSKIVKIVVPICVVVFFSTLLLLLYCRRQRQVKKRQRLKANIRAYQPVLFDPYPHKSPYDLYRPGDTRVIEKPPPAFSGFPQRISQASSLDSDSSTVEPVSPVSSAEAHTTRRHRSSYSAFSSITPLSYPYGHDRSWEYIIPKSGTVSRGSDDQLPKRQNPGPSSVMTDNPNVL